MRDDDRVQEQEDEGVGTCIEHRKSKELEIPKDPLAIECDVQPCRFDCPLAPDDTLFYHVQKAVNMVKWLDAMPECMLGTQLSERAWDCLGGRIDEVLEAIGAEKGEDGYFTCYDTDGGPKEEMEKWLKEHRKEEDDE